MRLSLSVKFGLLSVLLVVLVAGATSYLMVFRFGSSSEQELVSRDRELARVLAGLRTADGKLDFETIAAFVGSSDRVDTGLVYALELESGSKLLQGAINPRLFSAMDADFEVAMLEGRERVLGQLAAGRVDRKGKIVEYRFDGKVLLGFDLERIHRQIREQQQVALAILLAGLAVGVVSAVILSRRLARPVKRLAGAMEAVARGEVDQTVQVTSTDELASLARSFNQMTRALRDMARVQQLFALYMSEEVKQRLLRERNPLEMVAEERAVTVLSAAFHDFEPLARQLSPRETIGLVNDYLAPIIDAITEHGGVVERLDGERLVAVWGAPNDVADAELRAIRAAQGAQQACAAEGRRQAAAGGLALALKIGISSGRAIAGNLGSARRVTYRVLGAAVDMARRIENMAGPGEIVASEATYSKVRKHVEARPCAPLILEELEEAVPLYRIELTGAGRRSG